jgi:hypothetical protein
MSDFKLLTRIAEHGEALFQKVAEERSAKKI